MDGDRHNDIAYGQPIAEDGHNGIVVIICLRQWENKYLVFPHAMSVF